MKSIRALIIGIGLLDFGSAGAADFDQPEVNYYVQRRSAGEMVDCKLAAAPLGEWAFITLSDGSKVEALAAPLDAKGQSALRVKIVSRERVVEHEFNHSAKLTQSSPSFTWSAPKMWPLHGVFILVESPALLATTRAQPSWRDFDPRTNPGLAKRRPVKEGGCGMEQQARHSRGGGNPA